MKSMVARVMKREYSNMVTRVMKRLVSGKDTATLECQNLNQNVQYFDNCANFLTIQDILGIRLPYFSK